MKSDKRFDEASAGILTPAGSSGQKLRRNPLISRYWQTLHKRNVDKGVLRSGTMRLDQLRVRNLVRKNSRILTWDDQRIFGPALVTRSSTENHEFEVE